MQIVGLQVFRGQSPRLQMLAQPVHGDHDTSETRTSLKAISPEIPGSVRLRRANDSCHFAATCARTALEAIQTRLSLYANKRKAKSKVSSSGLRNATKTYTFFIA